MLDYHRDVLPYLTAAGNRSWPANLIGAHHLTAQTLRKQLMEVFSDAYPKYLDRDRPREQKEQRAYRKAIYENVFRSFPTRIASLLDYVKQADDFGVQFPTTDVDEAESLQTYTGEHMTAEGSLIDWLFSSMREAYLFDTNSVLVVLPDDTAISENTYAKPIPRLLPCEHVIVHKKGKFAVIVSEEKTMLNTDLPGRPTGQVLFIIDQDSYTICRQRGYRTSAYNGSNLADWDVMGVEYLFDLEGNPLTDFLFRPPLHYCPSLPVRTIGRKRKKRTASGEELFESILTDSLPHIRLGQRAQSDIQVEANFHVSSQEYRYETNPCPNSLCQEGIVYTRGEDGEVQEAKVCPTCQGTRLNISGSGLDKIIIDAQPKDVLDRTGQMMAFAAPGGFIPRNIEALREFVVELNRHINEAYGTINMQFLRSTPAAQSGLAKLYDREELYRELNTEGTHICGLLQFLFRCIDAQRYGPTGQAGEQCPQVLAPVRFNIENAELTRDELNNAKDKKYDSTLVEAYETKMLLYTVGENSDEYERYMLRKRLDPFKDKSDEIKIYLLGLALRNDPTPEQKAYIERIYFSLNFAGLVSDCLRADPDFWTLDLSKQYEALMKLSNTFVGEQRTGSNVPQLKLQPPVNIEETNQILQETKA